VRNIVFRVIVPDCLSVEASLAKQETDFAERSRPATSTSVHQSRFGKPRKEDKAVSAPYT
jgi:hypothetical protein